MIMRRLFRRIRWFLFYQWHTLLWPYESCQRCGKAFQICWSVEDVYWQKVIGVSDDSGGSLCIDCFIELANDLKITIPDEAFRIEIFQPDLS